MSAIQTLKMFGVDCGVEDVKRLSGAISKELLMRAANQRAISSVHEGVVRQLLPEDLTGARTRYWEQMFPGGVNEFRYEGVVDSWNVFCTYGLITARNLVKMIEIHQTNIRRALFFLPLPKIYVEPRVVANVRLSGGLEIPPPTKASNVFIFGSPIFFDRSDMFSIQMRSDLSGTDNVQIIGQVVEQKGRTIAP